MNVVLLPSQQAIHATIVRPVPECGFGQEASLAYELKIDPPVEQVYGSIAIRGAVPAPMTFRQCAGSEALRLTAWDRGRRVWSGFYYLGYDVEPDCPTENIQ